MGDHHDATLGSGIHDAADDQTNPVANLAPGLASRRPGVGITRFEECQEIGISLLDLTSLEARPVADIDLAQPRLEHRLQAQHLPECARSFPGASQVAADESTHLRSRQIALQGQRQGGRLAAPLRRKRGIGVALPATICVPVGLGMPDKA